MPTAPAAPRSRAARQAFITGASGFIGWHLATRLRDNGWSVTALARRQSRGALPPGVDRIALDLRAPQIVRAIRTGSVVFHCAGRTFAATRRAFDAANLHLTREVALAAQQAGARLVHVSSQAAAGPASPERPRTESDEDAPCSPYGASKLAGDRIVARMSALEWTIVRPVAVYGPRDRAFLPLFRLARAGYLPTFGDPAVSYMLVHVHDVVDALEQAAVRPEATGQVCFVGHPEPMPLDRILDGIARAVGRRVVSVRVGSPWLEAVAWGGSFASWCGVSASFDRSKLRELQAGGFVCAVTRAANLLGSVPAIALEDGMAATAAWYRAQGLLRPLRR